MTSVKTIAIGHGVEVDLVMGRKQEWVGLGGIRVGAVSLRDGSRPAVLRIDTPDGILYTRYELKSITGKPRRTTVVLRAFGLPWGRQEYQDEYSQQLVSVNDSLEPVEDEVILTFKPCTLKLGGRSWSGLTYAFGYRSAKRSIHRVLFDATWELGGSIVGKTVLNQSQCSMPVYRGQRGTSFLTSCLKRLELADSPQGLSYQLAPRGGMIQSFDFQQGPAGALLQYWPGFPAICSDVRKPLGSRHLHVLDEYRFPLAKRVTTVGQRVLFTPGPLEEHEVRDLWWEAYELVAGQTCRAFNIGRTEVRPEFDPPRSGRLQEGRLQIRVADEWVDACEAPYAVADRLLPRAAAAGVGRLMNSFVTENDASVLGFKRKLDSGLDGDLFCGSVCGTHRFFPSEFWGGMKAWRYLYEAGHKLGLEMGHWFAPHMSPRAAIFQEHPEWLSTSVHSLTTGGGYWNILAVLDWNTPVYDWILGDLRRWREEGGLDYLFVDSWPNLGLLSSNYSRSMQTNGERLARFFAEIQAFGIKALSFEGISPLGISRISMSDLRRDRADLLSGVVGQNDFGWWRDEMDMAYNLNIHLRPRQRQESDVQQMLFMAMANRGGLILPGLHGAGYMPPGWVSRLNQIYNSVLPDMRMRRLLPAGAGVRWEAGKRQVLWLYRDTSWTVPAGMWLERAEPGSWLPLDPADGRADLLAWQVYRIRPRGAGRD